MIYTFTANSIDLGTDDTEEVYTVSFNQASPNGGPPENYLLLQRSVSGVVDEETGEPEFQEPYVEFNDPSNGCFANSILSATLYPEKLELRYQPDSFIVAEPGISSDSDRIENLVINFTAETDLLRKLMLALNIVIADGFEYRVTI